jgi:DNA ligase-associated metallophosphoesterase
MTCDLTICDQQLSLLPQRALYWQAEATLFVADLHLGKPDAFLQAGIPVPTRVTQRDLDRLCEVIHATGARRLVILGDFLHARASHSPGVAESLFAWRDQCANVEILLVNGNHDLHAGPPPRELGFEICDEATVGPFYCVHVPVEEGNKPEAGFVLCGHLHPYGVVSGRTRESLRLPCFYVTPRQMVLPAFGHFTGGHTVHAKPDERVFVIAGDAVLPHRPARKVAPAAERKA